MLNDEGTNSIKSRNCVQGLVQSAEPSQTSSALEQINSPVFNYALFRGKDYTLGTHPLERYSKMLRQRTLIRDQMSQHGKSKGKYNRITNSELRKNIMDQTASYRQKCEDQSLLKF